MPSIKDHDKRKKKHAPRQVHHQESHNAKKHSGDVRKHNEERSESVSEDERSDSSLEGGHLNSVNGQLNVNTLNEDTLSENRNLAANSTKITPKRRPRQIDADQVANAGETVVDDDAVNVMDGDGDSERASSEAKKDERESPRADSFQSFSEAEAFELNFPGSFILKAKVPKVFGLAEKIAGDWVNDGKFESLPVGHPLVQIVASKALIKAKSVEKRVLSSAPVTLAKIGFEYAKSKIKR